MAEPSGANRQARPSELPVWATPGWPAGGGVGFVVTVRGVMLRVESTLSLLMKRSSVAFSLAVISQ